MKSASGLDGCAHPARLASHTQKLLQQLDEVGSQRRRHLCDEIIENTLPVADRLAARYQGRGIPMDDLRQVARTALVQAMRRFRGSGEQAFLAYVVPSIRGELRRHFRDAGWVVRPPRRIQEARLAINGAKAELSNTLGREPSDGEVAAHTELDLDTVRAARNVDHCYRPDSFDRPVGESPTTSLGDTQGTADPGFELAETRVLIRPLIDQLAPRDRALVKFRFFDGLTQRETGQRIGISQMQVSRVEARILRTMREALAA